MWGSFLLASLVALAVLYVPGFFAFRGLGCSRIVALCCAPLASMAGLASLPLAYELVGMQCSAANVMLPMLVAFLAIWGISRVKALRGKPRIDLPKLAPYAFKRQKLSFDWQMLALYLIVGLIVCIASFVMALPTADAFYCRYDNQTHLNMVRSFLDSGYWSSLHTDAYRGTASIDAESPYGLVSSSFYPAVWHTLVALVCSITGAGVPLGINAVNAVLTGVVFPTGMFIFMRALFPKNRLAIACGALVCMAFPALPWVFMYKGPSIANMAGVVLLPSFLGVTMLFADQRLVRKRPVCFLIIFLGSFAGLSVTHPNTMFTAIVFLVAYACHLCWKRMKSPQRFWAMGAILAATLALWLVCFNLPAFEQVVTFGGGTWDLYIAVGCLGLLRFSPYGVSVLMALLVYSGLVLCIARRWIWILFPAGFMGIAYILSLSSQSLIAHFIGGFWYLDHFRFSVYFSLFAAPVACFALSSFVRWARRRSAAGRERAGRAKSPDAVAAIVMAVFAVIAFFPCIWLPIEGGKVFSIGFGSVHEHLHDCYSREVNGVFEQDEREFAEQVLETVPEGALVLNYPADGSEFAYGTDDLNVYYRYLSITGHTDGAKAIRMHLSEIADNEKVLDAVKATGAHYLMMLDQGVAYEDGNWLMQFRKPESWKGIAAVTDDTPGFEVVLADGDKRLYRITAVDDAA